MARNSREPRWHSRYLGSCGHGGSGGELARLTPTRHPSRGKGHLCREEPSELKASWSLDCFRTTLAFQRTVPRSAARSGTNSGTQVFTTGDSAAATKAATNRQRLLQPGCAVTPKDPAKAPPSKRSRKATVARAVGRWTEPRLPDRPARQPLVVGMGASAGGLSAFKTFFENMPPDSGMTFVLVQHLAPAHKSMLADLLGKVTVMPVLEAEDGTPAEANKVYVIPPDATLTFKDRTLRVTRPAPPRERRRPIDTFFSTLAEDQGENAVCIVLSGTGSDGTLGLKAIKEHGGLVLAQADFDHMAMIGMPQSAAATGLVDELIPVEDMPAKLVDYQTHLLAVAPRKDGDGTRRDTAEHLSKIMTILRTRVGHDFSKYKEKTLVRRIQRRMQVLQIDTVPAYIHRLREDPKQAELLFRELLIGVTHFFRDPDAFAALESAIPKFFEHRRTEDQLRIWVPGCATGEEV